MAKKEINRIIVDLKDLSNTDSKRLLLEVHDQLLRATPVDTGWAVNNWIPSIGVPVEQTAGDKKHVTSSEKDKGVVEILRWKISGGPAYITNNVPYVKQLNDGSSEQAPKAFIEKAIMDAVSSANRRQFKK